MKRLPLDAIIRALVLVRMGQELGTDTPLARAIHDICTLALALLR